MAKSGKTSRGGGKKASPRKKAPARRKAAVKKSAPRGKAAQSARGRRRHGWLRLLLATVVLALLVLGGWSAYLSKTVRVKFEGKRWAVPARVYARPLELYEASPLSEAGLRYELGLLGYRVVAEPHAAAQWGKRGERFEIRTRGFRFWDGASQPALVQFRLVGGHVADLRIDGRDSAGDIVRLEPAEIGSIYPAHHEDRILVRRDEIPEHLVQALLAVEDRRFYAHRGVDPQGVLRALWANVRAGRAVQGGSTLTQQLVKNFFLTPERSLWRKFNEALMAIQVEARYGKDEILEAYANEIFLGQDGGRAIHGFGLAARFYFGRPLRELRLHETALLVGLVKGASYYNPRRHPQRARARRDLVLGQMVELGYVTAAEAARARSLPLGVTDGAQRSADRYPAFVDLVRRQLRRDYREEDLTSEGLRIFSTLDPWVQQRAARAVADELVRIEKARKLKAGGLQVALVLAEPQSGEVRALLGGRRGGRSGFNRALDAIRPIGSLVKPALYLAALERAGEFQLSSMLRDATVRLRQPDGSTWEPQNYDRQVHGPVPLMQALVRSYNLAAVNLGQELGFEAVADMLQRLGVTRPVQAYPSLVLGAVSLSPLEVAQVYQTLAAGGFRSPLRAIRAVLDARQEPLQRYPLTVDEAVAPGPVYLVSYAMREVARSGTARGLRRILGEDFAVAGKTGTTNDLRDSWFAGFSGDTVAVAWLGRDDNKPTRLTGASGAMRLWAAALRAVGARSLELAPPDDVEFHWVNAASGRLSAEGCPDATALPFIAGTQPRERSGCAADGAEDEVGLFDRLFR